VVCINSTIIVQESQKRRPERGWNGEHLLVILSEAKDLARWATRSFAALRMTQGGRFVSPRLMSRWGNMLESMPARGAPTFLIVQFKLESLLAPGVLCFLLSMLSGKLLRSGFHERQPLLVYNQGGRSVA
jgi:hypothetical protein